MAERFEPTWRCRLCGSKGLLAETHRHCCNCGHARDEEPIRFPEWDELVAPSDHRFHGTDLPCCDRSWSLAARHCGTCGTRFVELPIGLTALQA